MTQKKLLIPQELEIPPTGDITVLQDHMKRLCTHFGWETEAEKKFILLVEEVGEVAKAIRKYERITVDVTQKTDNRQALHQNLAEELADVFSYLLDIANQYDVDLGKAYTDKMSANFSRTWE